MKIDINDQYIITKVVPVNTTYEFNIRDFLKIYNDIESEDEIEDYIYEYLTDEAGYNNGIYKLLDGDNCYDLERDFEVPEIINLKELIQAILSELPDTVKTNCCDSECGNYCSVCGKKLK